MKAITGISIFNALILLFLAYRIGTPFFNSAESILSNTDSIGVFLMAQSNQFALLQILISALGIGLAGAGVWGYIAIKESAVNRAEATVKEEVPKLFNEMLKKFEREEFKRLIAETKMELAQQKKSDEIFQDAVEKMLEDPMDGAQG